MSTFIRLADNLSRALGLFAALLLIAAIIVVCQMILIRYVLAASTIWQTEFVIYSIMAATFLGSPYVLLNRGHVGVDLLPSALSGGPKMAVELAASAMSLAFCVLLAWSGWEYFHEAFSRGWKTETVWALPLWIPLLPLPLGIGVLCLQYVAEILKLTGARA